MSETGAPIAQTPQITPPVQSAEPVATPAAEPAQPPPLKQIADGMGGDQVNPETLNSILGFVEANPHVAKKPEIQEILQIAAAQGNPQAKAALGQPPVTPPAATPATPTATPTATPATSTATSTATPATPTGEQIFNEHTSAFFKEKGTQVPNNMTLEAFPDYVKNLYSIDVTTPEGFQKYLSSVSKFRVDSQQLATVQNERDQFKQTLSNMPQGMKMAVDSWLNGGNWQEVLKSVSKFDLEKGFDQHPLESTLRHFFPNEEFTSDDFTQDGLKDPKMRAFISLGKEKYDMQQQSIETQRAGLLEQAKAKKAAYGESVNRSVETLKSEFTSFGTAELDSVRNILLGEKIGELYYATDGTLKPDAAKRIAFAKYGEEALEEARNASAAKAATNANLAQVEGGSPAPAPSGGQHQEEQSPAQIDVASWGANESNPYSNVPS